MRTSSEGAGDGRGGRRAAWGYVLMLLALGFFPQACTTLQATDSYVPPVLQLRTSDGYTKWHKQFLTLNWQLLTAKARYEREKSPDALRAYEVAAKKCFDHGYALYWAYTRDNQPTAPDKEAMATVGVISPYLNDMGNHLITVAEEYIKQGNPAAGTAIAAHLVTHYPAVALSSVRTRAEGLLGQYRNAPAL